MNYNFKEDLLLSFVEKININCSYINYYYKIAIQIIYIYNIVKDEEFKKKEIMIFKLIMMIFSAMKIVSIKILKKLNN